MRKFGYLCSRRFLASVIAVGDLGVRLDEVLCDVDRPVCRRYGGGLLPVWNRSVGLKNDGIVKNS